MRAVYYEEILNVDQPGFVYVEKYTLILNKHDVRELIRFMCQERASSGLF